MKHRSSYYMAFPGHMKNIFILIISMFIAGCISSVQHPYFDIEESCNSFYNANKRWPNSEKELIEYDNNHYKGKINWTAISDFSIKKISEDQLYIIYSEQEWYGKNTVSGSIYRPIVEVNINYNNPDN